MMHLLLSWAVLAGAVWVTSMIVPGFKVEGAKGAIGVAAVFGLLGAVIGKVLFVLIGIGTLGLGFLLAFVTRWFVNVVLLKVTDAMLDSLTIDSTRTAMIAAVVMSALGTAGEWLLRLG